MTRKLSNLDSFNAWLTGSTLNIRKSAPEAIAEFEGQFSQAVENGLQYLTKSEKDGLVQYEVIDPMDYEEFLGEQDPAIEDEIYRNVWSALMAIPPLYINAVAVVTDAELPTLPATHEGMRTLSMSAKGKWGGEFVIQNGSEGWVAFGWNDSWDSVSENLSAGSRYHTSFHTGRYVLVTRA